MDKLLVRVLSWECMLDMFGSSYALCKHFRIPLGKGRKRLKKKRAKNIALSWIVNDLRDIQQGKDI